MGSSLNPLTETEIGSICRDALDKIELKAKKVLVLIPDHTRHAPIHIFFKAIFKLISRRVKKLDYLIANGTHSPMEMDRIYAHVGITAEEHRTIYRDVEFFNHLYNKTGELTGIGTLKAAKIEEITGGLFREDIEVTINGKILEYDHILLVTPVVPHEAVGFAGGNKYFFPGVAGLEVVQTFHWLAAVITNPKINGVKDTPTRRVINEAVKFIPTPRTCFAFAVNEKDELMCLFAGDPADAWSKAADYSKEMHIRYLEKPFSKVLAITPAIYEDMWVGGKAMYKLEPVVADGGELIIYGPKIRNISFMHEESIKRLGYHTIDYFVKQPERFKHEEKLIMAHSSNVRGVGSYENGVEKPRITVTLATSISESDCRMVNLNYLDPSSINPDKWRGRTDTLVVDNAGQDLYRLGK